ncbi:homeotic protein empty spiracles [Triticum aestivum]|uniref:homeotic protein empty spiracles n=1 Tax=Triticum aestivum TaxID=4565 RepID=UPI001D021542|nr:homeotic protein empty spiracles-like [Triticum aestivum]
METSGEEGRVQSVSQPDSISETNVAPESGTQPPSKEGGSLSHPSPARRHLPTFSLGICLIHSPTTSSPKLPPPSSRLNPRRPCAVLLPCPSLCHVQRPTPAGCSSSSRIPDSRAPPPSSSQDPPWKPHRLAKYLAGEHLHGAEELLHVVSAPAHLASAVSSTLPASTTAKAASSPRHRASAGRRTSPVSPLPLCLSAERAQPPRSSCHAGSEVDPSGLAVLLASPASVSAGSWPFVHRENPPPPSVSPARHLAGGRGPLSHLKPSQSASVSASSREGRRLLPRASSSLAWAARAPRPSASPAQLALCRPPPPHQPS